MIDFMKPMDAATLASTPDHPDRCLIDCRFDLMSPDAGYRDYLAGHLPGAVYADLDKDLAGPMSSDSGRHPLPDIEKLTARLRQLGISEHTEIIVYDHGNNGIAARAWWLLRWLGHKRVTLLDGGFSLWHKHGLPLEQGPVTKKPGSFHGRCQQNATISTSELEKMSATGGLDRVVDARAAARFAGQVEPIDSVAGHIPGTMNLPFTDCLEEEGVWKSPEELRATLAQVLGEDLQAPWSVMCGSGVTACHLAVSGLLAGYREPKLYVGSWSEWIRNPRRPVATGSA